MESLKSKSTTGSVVTKNQGITTGSHFPRDIFGGLQCLVRTASGTFGEVFHCVDKRTSCHVALKVLRIEEWEETDGKLVDPTQRVTDCGIPAAVLREIAILQSLKGKSKHLVQLHDFRVSYKNGQIGLVLDWVSGVDVDSFLRSKNTLRERPLLRVIQSIARQLLSAIEILHSHGVLHRDVKPSNIMYNAARDHLTLVDFGLGRYLCDDSRTLSVEAFSTEYKPPDVILGRADYDFAGDIYSVGAVIAELFTLRPLFTAIAYVHKPQCVSDYPELPTVFRYFSIMGTPGAEELSAYLPDLDNVTFPSWPVASSPETSTLNKLLQRNGSVPSEVVDLLFSMLRFNGADRPTAADCLRHNFFSLHF